MAQNIVPSVNGRLLTEEEQLQLCHGIDAGKSAYAYISTDLDEAIAHKEEEDENEGPESKMEAPAYRAGFVLGFLSCAETLSGEEEEAYLEVAQYEQAARDLGKSIDITLADEEYDEEKNATVEA